MEQSAKSASENHAQSTVGLTTPSAKAVGQQPLPWKLSNPADDGYAFRILAANFPQDGEEAIVGDLIRPPDNGRKQFEAASQFLVRACNSHYQLLSALKELVAGFSPLLRRALNEDMTERIEAAEQAISQAESEAAHG